MLQRPVNRTPESLDNAIEHYLYDLSLPLNERAVNKKEFKSGMAAANYLGVEPRRVYNNRKFGFRVWSPIYQKWFAIRTK